MSAAAAESALSDLRTALKGDDKDVIARKTDALAQASAKVAQRAYADTQGAAGAAGAQPGGAAGAGAAGAGRSGAKDDVVDAEFEEVKDKDRRAS